MEEQGIRRRGRPKTVVNLQEHKSNYFKDYYKNNKDKFGYNGNYEYKKQTVEECKEAVIKLYQDGVSIRNIEKQTGISRYYIKKVINNL